MGGLLQQAQAMQAQLAQAQTDLAGMRFSGTAGGGLVAATVSGQGELLSVEISPQAVDPEDAETLGDLVVAAVREATAKARRVAEASVPQVPGF
ncbi:MAG: YbaB/EbfC family nucleoid-associated protein [Propionibacteriaceae bacterium]|nr:YbaB/EbfC family nucleoid-associated protein [Propionibacteriaceae bacterium]